MRGAKAGFVGGANYCTTSRNSTLAYLAVLSTCQRQEVVVKQGFLWGYVQKKARAGSFVGKSERNSRVRYG